MTLANRAQSSSPLSRSSITTSALRRGDLKISDPIPNSAHGLNATEAQSNGLDTTPVAYPDHIWPRKAPSPRNDAKAGSTGYRQDAATPGISVNDLNRASMGPSTIQSSMSTMPSKTSLGQRNTGGFKAAFRRLFGSKRHRASLGDTRREFHQSDPGKLTALADEQLVNSRIDRKVPRTPSQQLRTGTRSSALSSHSPLEAHGHDKRSRWEAPTDWKTLRPRHTRRNTLPSVVLSQQEAQLIARALDQNIARLSGQATLDPATEYEPTPKALKRRSRSADALNELAATLDGSQFNPRDRADEISYWRTTALCDSAFSDYAQPSQAPLTSEGVKRLTREALQVEPAPSRPSQTPSQAFDFGLPKGTNESVSLEERVGTLEVKVVDFEYAIAKLQGNDDPKQITSARTPKRRSIHELFPTASSLFTATPDSNYPQTFLTSPVDSLMGPDPVGESGHPHRSSSTTTIQPPTTRARSPKRSAATSPAPARLHLDNFDTILALVKEEQVARKRLEGRVRELQKEIDDLRAPVYAYIRPATIPTPNSESTHNTPIAPKARGLHRTPAFPSNQRPNVQETSRFSMTDPEDSDADRSDTEEGFYEAPQENRYTFESTRSHFSPMSSPAVGMI